MLAKRMVIHHYPISPEIVQMETKKPARKIKEPNGLYKATSVLSLLPPMNFRCIEGLRRPTAGQTTAKKQTSWCNSQLLNFHLEGSDFKSPVVR